MQPTNGVPVTGTDVCAGHPCDGCWRCRKGVCCRRDDPSWRRPQMGDWDGFIYGELGVLVAEEDGNRLVCHACGQAYRNLGSHAVQGHQLLAFEYKAIFGLRATTSLLAPVLAERHRQQHLATLSQFWERASEVARSLTPEQRSAYARGRTWALEARRDPANRQQWQELIQRAQAGARAARAAGRRWWRDPRAFAALGRARHAELRQDPAWVARWREKYEAGRARSRDPRQALGHTPKPCIVCGVPVTQATGRSTCSDRCEFEARSRKGRRQKLGPEARLRISVSRKRRLAEDPARQQTGALLRALPSERLDALPERERLAVRAYYALDGESETPPTLKELADRIGLHATPSAQRVVRRALAALLDPASADPTGADLVTCGVCGRQIYRPTRASEHACSDACLAELRRRSRKRQQIREQATLEPLRRALEALPPAALDGLAERDRIILRMRYGLGAEQVHSQDEIADQLGLKQPLVSSVVRRVTARLLGWEAVDPDGRHRVTCTICGATTHVHRRKPSGEQTCGPECAKELLRRKIRANRHARRLMELMPVRDRLSALPVDAFEVLRERDQAIVRRYYGMEEDGIFYTQDELAHEFGLTQTTIGTIVRNAATRLLPSMRLLGDPAARTPGQDDRPVFPAQDRAR